MSYVTGDIKVYGTGAGPGTTSTLAEPTLDGAPWDLTGGSATLHFFRPDRVLLTKTGTITNKIPQYVDSPSSLTIPGEWQRWWVLVDANGVQETLPVVRFTVAPAPVI